MLKNLVEKIKAKAADMGKKNFIICLVFALVFAIGAGMLTYGIITLVNLNDSNNGIADNSSVISSDNNSSVDNNKNDDITSDNATSDDATTDNSDVTSSEDDVTSSETQDNNSSNNNSSNTNSGNNSSNNSSSNNSNSSNNSSSNNSSNNNSSNNSSSDDEYYLDESLITGTEEDIGKVVGYDPTLKEEIVVTDIIEGTTTDGRKSVEVVYSDGTCSFVVECEYCHKFPCPNGGQKNCSDYDPLKDTSVTCAFCGLKLGNGYNNTCHQTVDWVNGITICNHYD